jgi:hypothetical protein
LHTGDGRVLPRQLKAEIVRELKRLELVLEMIATVETERDAILIAARTVWHGLQVITWRARPARLRPVWQSLKVPVMPEIAGPSAEALFLFLRFELLDRVQRDAGQLES